MKIAIAFALLLPMLSADKTAQPWQPFQSMASQLRFEVPNPPEERHLESGIGTEVRSFVCKEEDVVFEAVAIQMTPDLKLSLQEAVSDSDVSVSRQIIDDVVEQALEEMEVLPEATEYTRLQKFPCRISQAKLPGNRKVKLLSTIAKNHIYLFIVSHPTDAQSPKTAKRFFESIRFEG